MGRYPSQQPFPRVRAVSIEASAGPGSPSLTSLRTFELPPYADAKRTMYSYLESYERTSNGAAVGISGGFGSGKTHLINFLMEKGRAFSAAATVTAAPVQVYVKAKTGSFFEIYREFVSALGAQQLAQAHLKVLSMAGQQLITKGNIPFDAPAAGGAIVAVADQLRRKPELVLNLIRDAFLSETEIVDKAASELRGDSSRFTDFFMAFTFLNDPAMQATAYSWFQGVNVGSENLQRLGVSGPVTAVDANRGLQFISTMYSFGRTPLIVYIDQIERLILSDIDGREANRGQLQSLIEAVVSNRNMLVVAGVSQAWDQLTPDFLQRLTIPPIVMPSLDLNQTQAIVAVWLADDPKTFDASEIFPFTRDGLREIVRLSRGNIRSTISLCYSCFEIAQPNQTTIGPNVVQQAAKNLEKLFNRATVLSEIETCLNAIQLNYERHIVLADDRQDIVVPNITSPAAVINVMEPVFLEDEARDAHAHAAAAQKLRADFPHIRYVLVDVGYRTGEIEGILRPPLIDFYIRYDPDGFSTQFREILNTIRSTKAVVDSSGGDIDAKVITESIRQLQELVVVRTDQQDKINVRLAEILQSIGKSGGSSINIQNTPPTNHKWQPYLPLVAIATVLAILSLGLVAGVSLWQQQRHEAVIARSLQYIDKSSGTAFQNALSGVYSFIRDPSLSIKGGLPRDVELDESVFNVLRRFLQNSDSSLQNTDMESVLSYYGSVVGCIEGKLCDQRTICDALVPQITSLQAAIARAMNAPRSAGGKPAPDRSTWTEADRLLDVCRS